LKVVKKEIFLRNFDFNNTTLKKILANSCQVNRLVFHDCKFKIKNTFKAGKTAYKIKQLNLYDCFKLRTAEFGYMFEGLKGSGLDTIKFDLELSDKDFNERIENRASQKKKQVGGKKGKIVTDTVLETAIELELGELIDSISFKYKIIDCGDYFYKGQVVGDEIAGHGMYIWKKGKAYTHHYCLDLYYQYEEKLMPNGDMYKGYVRDGKYHGLGILIKKGDKEEEGEHALWSYGERIEEFDEEEVLQINAGRGHSLDFFLKNRKYVKHLDNNQTFDKPEWFDAVIADVEERVAFIERKKKTEYDFLFYEDQRFYSAEGKRIEQLYRSKLKKELDEKGYISNDSVDEEDIDKYEDDDTEINDPEEKLKELGYKNCVVKLNKAVPTFKH